MSQDVVHRLIQDFKSLPTKQARRTVLNAILDDLTIDERRELNARQDPLYCDILGSLPLELVLEVARYFDPLEAWVFQRVSKRWQAVLSSKEIYSAIYLPFYPSPLPTSGDKYLSATDIMRCKYGFHRAGVYYRWPNGMECSFKDTTAEQSVSYSSGKVAWLSADQRRACIRDLTTGAVMEFVTETRGMIRLLHLSESFLFVQASGYCTAWELSMGQSHLIRLPSPHILEISSRNNRAIILIGRPSDGWTILSWHLRGSYGSDSVRSARIDGQPLFTCWDTDSDAGCDIFFVIQAQKEAGLESYRFFRQRFAITDHGITSLDTKVLAVDQKVDLDFTCLFTFTRFNQLICRYGKVVSQILPLKSSEPGLVNIFMTYSTKTEALEIRTPVHKFDDDQRMQYYKGRMLTVDGTIYYPIVTWDLFRINRILEETKIFHSHLRSEILARYDPNRSRFVTFGDHQLFGVAHSKGIEFWTFDSNLRLAFDA